MKQLYILSLIILLGIAGASAQLTVVVNLPQVVGQKAIVKIAMKNDLPETVESARAVCFLLDDHGKMVGQSTKWVIGEHNVGLASGVTNSFNFVIANPGPFATTNLTASISFSRLVLAGGKMADMHQDVTVLAASK